MSDKYKPFKNLGPGYSIRREMEENDWNQKDLAEVLGFSEKHISRLLNNKEPVTIHTARLLAKAFGASPQFWVNLDTNYRLHLEETAQEKTTEAKALIYRYMPVRDMRAKGWLPKKDEELVDAVKAFWRRKNLTFDFLELQAAACFRKSGAFREFNQFYALTWLQKARIEVEKKSVSVFNANKLLSLAKEIPDYSVERNGVKEFITKLNDAGVKFLKLPHLEKTYIDGAAFMEKRNPVIVYTARHNRIDNFWFTVTHEIAHVLKHLKPGDNVKIDNMDAIDSENISEQEANEFSAKMLKTKEILAYFEGVRRKSKIKILKCASELGVSEAIVVGCLHYHQELPYSSMRDLLPKIY